MHLGYLSWNPNGKVRSQASSMILQLTLYAQRHVAELLVTFLFQKKFIIEKGHQQPLLNGTAHVECKTICNIVASAAEQAKLHITLNEMGHLQLAMLATVDTSSSTTVGIVYSLLKPTSLIDGHMIPLGS